jgi:prepilin-type N-terminal cleavage/methylation domain-containing protein
MGFTLLEVIIAITILAFMSLTVTKMLQNGLERKDTVTKEDRDRLQVENFWSRLSLDIAQNYTPLYYDLLATPDPNNPDAQTLEAFPAMTKNDYVVPVPLESDGGWVFFTASNRRRQEGQKQSNYTWVRYELIELEDQTKAVARRQMAGKVFYGVFEWDKIKPQIILKRVKSLQFLFWHPAKEKFMEHLKDLGSPVVLRGIKVILKWEDLLGQEQEFERIFRVAWPLFRPEEAERNSGQNGVNGNQNRSGSSGPSNSGNNANY